MGGTANIGATTYNWLDMNDASADTDNALLISHAGISCLTHYKSGGSTSTPGRARDGFVYNWGISSSADVKWRFWHLNTWEDDLKDELDLERPILYSAGGAEIGDDWVYGHSWIIDGYNSSDEFHCNWGWYGNENGWFSLGGFEPYDNNYNQMESAIFNVVPVQLAGVATPQLSNQSFNYSSGGYALSIPSAYGATSYQWITDKGTISGSGSSVTLYSESTANVQVRAYNNNCEIYSPYDAAAITINYGPISVPDIICYSGHTVSISNVPNITITWGGTNVAYPNGNTGISVTVRAASTSTANAGTITASFTVDNTPYIISNTVWVGKPAFTGTISGNISIPLDGTEHYRVNSSDVLEQHLTVYDWDVTSNLQMVSSHYYQQDVYVKGLTLGRGSVYFISSNTCGSSQSSLPVRVTNFLLLAITPNPASGETTLSIEWASEEKTFDENAEWELEVYSQGQLLKEKKTNLKGRSTKIQTAGWKDGVYLVRVKYKDEILTGKLVVKK